MGHPTFLAFDLGAESGRAVLGVLENQKLRLEELSRFPNGMLRIHGHWMWNLFRLFEEMKKALAEAFRKEATSPQSLGVDTWGVDFALLAKDGSFLGIPFAYRDHRTEGAMESFFKKISRERIYRLTGIQFLPFNTLFQLHSMKRDRSPLLNVAKDLLFMPDCFNYLFTGEKASEFSFATTSQLFNPAKGRWEAELFDALGIPSTFMQQVLSPGTVLGQLEASLAGEIRSPRIPVVAVALHDTASAVAAVPAQGEDWAYLSSGTWSLLGVELKKPVLTRQALGANFTNEGGVGKTIRFLRNIVGLWILQQCQKSWTGQFPCTYDELVAMAEAAPPSESYIDPDYPSFLNPPDMPEAIREFCRTTDQPIPDSPARIVRCLLESLVLKYRTVLDQLRKISGRPIRRLHVIGGGSKNRLLCQWTADAAGMPVVAGPMEATSVGNLLMQAVALGVLHSLDELRAVVRNSFEMTVYEPRESDVWDRRLRRFQERCGTRTGP